MKRGRRGCPSPIHEFFWNLPSKQMPPPLGRPFLKMKPSPYLHWKMTPPHSPLKNEASFWEITPRKKKPKYRKLLLIYAFHFICYLAAPWPTLCHYQGDSPDVNHFVFINFRLEGHREPRNESLLGRPPERSRWWLKHLRAEPSCQSQHPAKFSDHKSCESGDRGFSNSHVV